MLFTRTLLVLFLNLKHIYTIDRPFLPALTLVKHSHIRQVHSTTPVGIHSFQIALFKLFFSSFLLQFAIAPVILFAVAPVIHLFKSFFSSLYQFFLPLYQCYIIYQLKKRWCIVGMLGSVNFIFWGALFQWWLQESLWNILRNFLTPKNLYWPLYRLKQSIEFTRKSKRVGSKFQKLIKSAGSMQNTVKVDIILKKTICKKQKQKKQQLFISNSVSVSRIGRFPYTLKFLSKKFSPYCYANVIFSHTV